MTDSEVKALMEHHGITVTQHAVYHYEGFKYGNAMSAVSYAELLKSRELAAREQTQASR